MMRRLQSVSALFLYSRYIVFYPNLHYGTVSQLLGTSSSITYPYLNTSLITTDLMIAVVVFSLDGSAVYKIEKLRIGKKEEKRRALAGLPASHDSE